MINYACPNCSRDMASPDGQVGEVEHCPHCGFATAVPKPARAKTKAQEVEFARDMYWIAISICVLGGIVLALYVGGIAGGIAAGLCFANSMLLGILFAILRGQITAK